VAERDALKEELEEVQQNQTRLEGLVTAAETSRATAEDFLAASVERERAHKREGGDEREAAEASLAIAVEEREAAMKKLALEEEAMQRMEASLAVAVAERAASKEALAAVECELERLRAVVADLEAREREREAAGRDLGRTDEEAVRLAQVVMAAEAERQDALETAERLAVKVQGLEEALELAQLDLEIVREELALQAFPDAPGPDVGGEGGAGARLGSVPGERGGAGGQGMGLLAGFEGGGELGGVGGDGEAEELKGKIAALTRALQQVHAKYVAGVQEQEQLRADLEIALEAVDEAERLRVEVSAVRDACAHLQEQVDAAEEVSAIVASLTDKCAAHEERIEEQQKALAEQEEMVQVLEEVEEHQVEEIRQLRLEVADRDAAASQQQLALQTVGQQMQEALRAAERSSNMVVDLQRRLDELQQQHQGAESVAMQKSGSLHALYNERVALKTKLAAAQQRAAAAGVYAFRTKALALQHKWLLNYLPQNWLERDAAAATLLISLLKLVHALRLLSHVVDLARQDADDDVTEVMEVTALNGDVVVSDEVATGGGGKGGAGGARSEKMLALGQRAQSLFADVWCLDVCPSLAVGAGEGVRGDAREECSVETAGGLYIVFGFSVDIARIATRVEDLLLAAGAQGVGGAAGRRHEEQLEGVLRATEDCLSQVESRVTELGGGGRGEGRQEVEAAVETFLVTADTNARPLLSPGRTGGADVGAAGGEGESSDKGLLIGAPAGMHSRAERAKARLGDAQSLERKLEQSNKDLFAHALSLREKTHEMEALQLQIHALQAEVDRSAEKVGGGEAEKVKQDFAKYKAEAEEAINKLVVEEEALQRMVAKLKAKTASSPVGGSTRRRLGDGDPGGSGQEVLGAEGGGWGSEEASEALLAHVAALRRSATISRARKAQARILRELPPLPGLHERVRVREGARDSCVDGGQDRDVTHHDVSKTCPAPSVTRTRANGAGAEAVGEGSGGEALWQALEWRGHGASQEGVMDEGEGGLGERERGRRESVIACSAQVQKLQWLMLQASVSPKIVSLTPARDAPQSRVGGGGDGGGDEAGVCGGGLGEQWLGGGGVSWSRSWSEVRRSMLVARQTTKGLA
jgi:hypothetical protein